jgi:hypothetical protein
MVWEDGKVHMETTFVSSLFKGLSKRDVVVVEDGTLKGCVPLVPKVHTYLSCD